MRVRYLALGPLGGARARGGPRRRRAALADAIARDADWPGARARRGAGVGAARRRRGPRRRGSRSRAARARGGPRGARRRRRTPRPTPCARRRTRCEREGWWFVKAQAVALLANAPASRDVDDALGGALHDPSVRVRGGAIVALARRRAVPWRSTIRERLDDPGEDSEIRAAAASALGALCDTDSADRSPSSRVRSGSPAVGRGRAAARLRRARGPGGAAPGGSAEPHRRRSSRSSAPPYARAAAQRALAARGDVQVGRGRHAGRARMPASAWTERRDHGRHRANLPGRSEPEARGRLDVRRRPHHRRSSRPGTRRAR